MRISWQPGTARLVCLLAVAAVFGGPGAFGVAEERSSSLPTVEPAAAGMDAEALSRIAERMRGFAAANEFSGAVTLVAREGRIVHHEAVGLARLEGERTMRKDSLFAIASMTKPITATAVMILQDEGKLSLDDPVSKHIPAFADAKLKEGTKPQTAMTLRHLLTHTSGLGGEQQNIGTLQNTAQELAKRGLEFEPGTKWQYGPSLSVCGAVVEVVSGQAFDEFLTERIFRPLGMKDTTFAPSAGQQERLVQLYEPSDDKQSLKPAKHWINDLSPGRTPNPSGGLFSTAADMARFYQMVLNGGELGGRRVVSEQAVKEMTRLQTGELTTGFTPGNGWGLGWCVVREPQGVSRMLSPGTFGHGGAFGTQGWIDPERKMVFVLLIQRTKFGNSDGSEIRESLQELAVEAIRE